MKYLLVLLALTLFSTIASAKPCVRDTNCAVESTNGYSCFLVQTGTDYNDAITCNVRCLPADTGALCLKNQHRPVGKCVDLRLKNWETWTQDLGCKKALSPRLWKRIQQ